MAASKRLIQLGSRLRAIHVVSTMNTPPLGRTSVNSYRLLSSSSSGYGSESRTKQDQELAFLRNEITKLQKMREEITELQYHNRKMRGEIQELEFDIRKLRDKLGHWVSRRYDDDDINCVTEDFHDTI